MNINNKFKEFQWQKFRTQSSNLKLIIKLVRSQDQITKLMKKLI